MELGQRNRMWLSVNGKQILSIIKATQMEI